MNTYLASMELARSFVLSSARPLEKARWLVAFEGGKRPAIVGELARFQNADGGFGKAIEPDIRASGSSAIGLATALQILREARPIWNEEVCRRMIERAAAWVCREMDQGSLSWRAVPDDLNAADHAPWWQPISAKDCLDNPRPEVLAFALDHAWAFDQHWTEALRASVFDRWDQVPESMEMHTFLSYASLLQSPLTEAERLNLIEKLARAASQIVNTDPASWTGYVMRPADAFPRPTQGLSEPFREGIRADFDQRIGEQKEDGSWRPTWDWEGESWSAAEREWAGVLTFQTVLRMRDHGLIG